MADETSTPTPATPSPTPGKPPVIGVRPITIKPAVPPSAMPPASAATPAASPATIRLKPIAPPSAPAVPSVPAAGGDVAPTVRVKPVIAAQPAISVAGAPKPGSAPLPPGPKPLKPEQVQAAKAKTSRISLDAALIGGQEDRGGPKTIRLKRPTDAPVGKITSHLGAAAAAATGQAVPSQRRSSPLVPPIPSAPTPPVVNRFTTSVETPDPEVIVRRSGVISIAGETVAPAAAPKGDTAPVAAGAAPALHGTTMVPAEAAGQEESSITRRKTIRVKRPGAMVVSTASAGGAKAAATEGSEGGEAAGGTEEPFVAAPPFIPVEKTHWIFPVLAIAALFVMIALVIVQSAQDRELPKLTAWPPNSPAIKLPGMAPIPGRG